MFGEVRARRSGRRRQMPEANLGAEPLGRDWTSASGSDQGGAHEWAASAIWTRDLDSRRSGDVLSWLSLSNADGGDPAVERKPVCLVARRAIGLA
jgi:hypothetical protein